MRLTGPRLGLNSGLRHTAHHAVLHMAPKWLAHWTTRAEIFWSYYLKYLIILLSYIFYLTGLATRSMWCCTDLQLVFVICNIFSLEDQFWAPVLWFCLQYVVLYVCSMELHKPVSWWTWLISSTLILFLICSLPMVRTYDVPFAHRHRCFVIQLSFSTIR